MTRTKKKGETSAINSSSGFEENDRITLNKINNTILNLVEEVKYLRIELENSKVEVNCLKTENERLKQVINLTLYKVDEIEQYGRRENIRIHGIKESLTKEDDGETIINEMSKDLNIELTLNDIQRAHRLGRRSFSETQDLDQ